MKSLFSVAYTDSDILVILDLFDEIKIPWNKTVTNNAEEVVEFLFEKNILKDGQKLYYIDTDDLFSRLLYKIKNGKAVFTGFSDEQPTEIDEELIRV